jgi:hypothetical protein
MGRRTLRNGHRAGRNSQRTRRERRDLPGFPAKRDESREVREGPPGGLQFCGKYGIAGRKNIRRSVVHAR